MSRLEEQNNEQVKAMIALVENPVVDLEDTILQAVEPKSAMRHSLDQYIKNARLGLKVMNGCLVVFVLFILSSLLDFPPGVDLLGDYTVPFAVGFAGLTFLQFQIRDYLKGLV